ncbi:hypothetical protein BG004_003100, partial [Podila humilis]
MKFTATLLSLAAAASMVSAGRFIPIERPNAGLVENAFIVEYEDGVSHTKANNFFNSRKVNYKVRAEYNVFNGASIQVSSAHAGEDLAKIPGVKRVWPVEIFSVGVPKPEDVDPVKALLTASHPMTGVDYVQKTYKYTGKGVKIGVIDSGVDYTHPALGGCFGKGCRVRYGWDFVGDDVLKPKQDSDPRDTCNGHGTHVAGIIGADARKVGAPHPFVGVAPEVTFGAYRALNCKGSGSNDNILLAMELAFNQGMDIINLSLGSGSNYKENPTAALADKLSALGLTVIAAAGNDGTEGVWDVSNSGLGELSTSVASFDNVGGFYPYFNYAKSERAYKFNPVAVLADKLTANGMAVIAAAGNDGTDGVGMVSDGGLGDLSISVASYDNIGGYYDYVKYGGVEHPYTPSGAWGKAINLPAGATLFPLTNKDGSLADGCKPENYPAESKGKVVLVLGDFTNCGSKGRGDVALAAGAAGMLIQSTPFGLAGLTGSDGFPQASIEFAAGDALFAAYKKTPTGAIGWSTKQKSFKVEGGGAPSSFSSLGLDGELRIKPDVAAP